MNAAERFVKVCGEVGNYTERLTGVSVVDAYTGPDELHPKKQSKDKAPSDIVQDILQTFDAMRDEIEDPLRLEYMMGELHSLNVVIDWLDGKEMSYAELVEGLFHIPMKKYSEREIDMRLVPLEEAMSDFPGDDLFEKHPSEFQAPISLSRDQVSVPPPQRHEQHPKGCHQSQLEFSHQHVSRVQTREHLQQQPPVSSKSPWF